MIIKKNLKIEEDQKVGNYLLYESTVDFNNNISNNAIHVVTNQKYYWKVGVLIFRIKK